MIRELRIEDAELMYEWMTNPMILNNLRISSSSLSIEKAKNFILNSSSETDVHFGITESDDKYLGTVSLKNIDRVNMNAEYAIVLRECAIGTGIAKSATEDIIDYGFNKLKLKKIYLNVLTKNKRAVGFYEKMNFVFEGEFKEHVLIDGVYYDLRWYAIINEKL